MATRRQVPCEFCHNLFAAGSVAKHERLCEQNPDRVPMMTPTRIGALRMLANGPIYGRDYPRGQIPAGALGATTGAVRAMRNEGMVETEVDGTRMLKIELTNLGRDLLRQYVDDAPRPLPTVGPVDRTSNKARGARRKHRAPNGATTEAIVQAVDAGATTVPEIAAAIGWATNGGGVYSAVSRAVELARIERVAKGRYGPVLGVGAMVPVPLPSVELEGPVVESRPSASPLVELRRQIDAENRVAAAMTAVGYPSRTSHVEPIQWIRWIAQTKEMITNGA